MKNTFSGHGNEEPAGLQEQIHAGYQRLLGIPHFPNQEEIFRLVENLARRRFPFPARLAYWMFKRALSFLEFMDRTGLFAITEDEGDDISYYVITWADELFWGHGVLDAYQGHCDTSVRLLGCIVFTALLNLEPYGADVRVVPLKGAFYIDLMNWVWDSREKDNEDQPLPF